MVKLAATARRLGLQGASWGIGPYHDLVVVHQLRWDLMTSFKPQTHIIDIVQTSSHLK